VVTRRQQVTVVRNGHVSLSVTDRGGDGPTIVLMPGLGMRQRSLDAVASRLTAWRVVTFDLRGHGESSTAPWSFTAAGDDLGALVAALGLEKPYVGGHSLGGMVALRYAMTGAPVAGVVNVDGWGPGLAARYVGEDPVAVEALLERISTGHLPSRLARVISGLTRQGRQGTSKQVLAELHRADVVAWHAAAPCPSVAINAVAPQGGWATWLLGAEMARLQRSHREGLQRDLAEVARQRPDVLVVEVDAGHDLITTRPDTVATAIQALHERTLA
jgi:pimeloyl-ACP methyl ester carboxylesterase